MCDEKKGCQTAEESKAKVEECASKKPTTCCEEEKEKAKESCCAPKCDKDK